MDHLEWMDAWIQAFTPTEAFGMEYTLKGANDGLHITLSLGDKFLKRIVSWGEMEYTLIEPDRFTDLVAEKMTTELKEHVDG